MYFERDGRTLARYLPDYSKKHVIYLHQSQTLNPEVFLEGEAFTMEDARVQKHLTTEALHLAINHFKKEGRRVTVIGHSYGAFIINDYLSNYSSAADQYILSAGRIKVPAAMTEDNIEGMSSNFLDDGLTYNDIVSVDLSGRTEIDRSAYIVRARLKGAYGEIDYEAGLAKKDLSNVTYVSGRSDQQVGQLTRLEIEFLKAQGAQVLIVDGGHSDVYKRMIDRVTDGTIKIE